MNPGGTLIHGHKDTTTSDIDRRAVLRAGAWTVPAIALAVATPASSASPVVTPYTGPWVLVVRVGAGPYPGVGGRTGGVGATGQGDWAGTGPTAPAAAPGIRFGGDTGGLPHTVANLTFTPVNPLSPRLTQSTIRAALFQSSGNPQVTVTLTNPDATEGAYQISMVATATSGDVTTRGIVFAASPQVSGSYTLSYSPPQPVPPTSPPIPSFATGFSLSFASGSGTSVLDYRSPATIPS